MIDPHSSEPSKRKSFFEEDFSKEHDEALQSNDRQPIYPNRERMASRYNDEDEEEYEGENLRKSSHFSDVFGEGGWNTRHLIYAAGGIGGILALFVGSWFIYNSTEKGIPIFSPPPRPAKEKPINTNNTETIGIGTGDMLNSDPSSNLTTLAPGPELANPEGLAKQYKSKSQPQVVNKSDDSTTQTLFPTNTNSATSSDMNSQPLPSSSSNEMNQAKPSQESLTSSKKQKNEADTEVTKSDKPTTNHLKSRKIKKKEILSSGIFEVQLSALGSEEAARKQWKIYSKKAPDVLNRRNPEIQRAEIGGKVVYRLRLRGFSSKTQASELCSRLKARSISCTLANF